MALSQTSSNLWSSSILLNVLNSSLIFLLYHLSFSSFPLCSSVFFVNWLIILPFPLHKFLMEVQEFPRNYLSPKSTPGTSTCLPSLSLHQLQHLMFNVVATFATSSSQFVSSSSKTTLPVVDLSDICINNSDQHYLL